jgi:2,4-dienoyl-CoA reductase (NADPH2)
MGTEEQLVHCVACGQGCFDNLFRMKGVECLCNPRAGHEQERNLNRTDAPCTVMVVGGGPAGMSAALAAAECGHRVSLFEKNSRLGGQLHLAGAPPGREEFIGLARDLEGQLAWHGVQVVLEQEVDQAFLADQQPDLVILATGGKPITPLIPGVDLPHVVQAWQVLAGKVAVGRRVVVVGGGAVGVETALLLAEEGTISGDALKFLLVHGAETPEELYRLATRGTRDVTVLELLDELGRNFGRTTRWGMLLDIAKAGITTMTESRVREITPTHVVVEKDGVEQQIDADTVILAVGTQSCNPLEQAVAGLGMSYRVVGDAATPAMVFDAVHQGFEAVRQLAGES